MQNKYLKNAIILVVVSFLTVTVIFALVFLSVRGTSCSNESSKSPPCSQEKASSLSLMLIENSSTFTFDGVKDSIKQVKVEPADNGQTWKLLYIFKTSHPGHGDRTGQVLAQIMTAHAAEITVSKCKVISAVCDKTWDMLKDRQLP